jgi:protein SCO1/2
MDRRILWIGIGICLLVAGTFAYAIFSTSAENYRGASYVEPYPPAPEFELTRPNGEMFRLSDQRGKVVLLFFGYTACPDVCPTTMAEMNLALLKIPEKASRVQVVFVSVDPERDTPQAAQEYVGRFNQNFIGLSGPQHVLENIWRDYGVFREEVVSDSAAGVIINHTARVTLIDQQGNMRLSYGFGTPIDDIVHDLNLILK